MLSIDDLEFAYSEMAVLNELSIEAEAGTIQGILGPNGSGKTSLLNIIAGHLSPDAGTVHWNNKSMTQDHISYLEAEPHFYPMITGREYLNVFRHQNPDFNVEEWNKLFDLPLDQLIESYSSGMKKKLALLAVICLNRPIVLLDEPFNNLDVDANMLVSEIMKLLAEKGKLILITSHIIEILVSMADYIHVLGEGRIAETVDKDAFLSWKNAYRTDEINAQINKAKDLL